MRGQTKIFHTNGNPKKTRVAILISDKIDFKIKTVTRDKESQYIMTKINLRRKYYNYKYFCTQCKSTSIHKANDKSQKRRNLTVGILTPYSHQWTDHKNRKLTRKHKSYMITLDEMDLIESSGHSIQMQKNTPSSQVHMEHSPG